MSERKTAKPTDILRHEHMVIRMVLDAARREAEGIDQTRKVDAKRVGKLVDFFRNFADRCHHAKEEDHLFRRMQQRGLPAEGGPIEAMEREHEEARLHLGAICEALPKAARGEAPAVEAVRMHLRDYADMLAEHIDREDKVLYPTADRILTSEDQQALAEAFERVEAEEIGKGVHERYHQLAHELAEE